VKEYETSQLRNIALVSHGGAGKTALAEAMLRSAGAISRLGRASEGNTTLDYSEEEISRQISLNLSVANVDWKGTKINIIDTPGYADFAGDMVAGIRVCDGGLLLLNATMGVESGAINAWEGLGERSLPVLLCVNMMDKDQADFGKAVDQARSLLSDKVAPLFLPIGKGAAFSGVVDLMRMKAYVHKGSEDGGFDEKDVPAELKAAAEDARAPLLDAAAETDDELLEKYLNSGSLAPDEVVGGLRKAVMERGLFPVVPVSAYNNVAVKPLLSLIAGLMPSPEDMPPAKAKDANSDAEVERKSSVSEPFSALIFKTISEPHVGELSLFRVYSGEAVAGAEAFNPSTRTTEKLGQIYHFVGKGRREVNKAIAGDLAGAVKLKASHTGETLCAKNSPILIERIAFPEPALTVAFAARVKGEEDKIGSGLARLREEDPTLQMRVDNEFKQILVSGMGDLHLEVVVSKLKKRLGVDIDVTDPLVPYRETITRTVEVQGRYKKQTGGRGQYGDVWVKLEPKARGEGFEFVDKIVGGVVPSKYIPAVEKGIVEAMTDGALAGYQLVDLRASLYDGSYHSVDSSDMAFKIAGSMALKKGAQQASPILLEPIMEVEVLVPEEYTGDIMGDLSSRRGKILGMNPKGRVQSIKALVPQAELHRYATHLRSITQGRGKHREKFYSYEVVPREMSEKVVAIAAERKAKVS
jgi:elongation factor G